VEASLDIRRQLTADVQEWLSQSSRLSTVRKVNTRRSETMVKSDERRTRSWSSKRESPLPIVLLFKSTIWDSVVSSMRSSFRTLERSTCAGCVVFPRVCRVRTRVHNARGRAPVEEYISSTGTPQAQMYSPNYLRITVLHVPTSARPSLRHNFFPSYSLSSPAHLHGMHSYEIDHSSVDFFSFSFSLSLSLSLSLYLISLSLISSRTHTRHDHLRGTSLGSLRSAVNLTEDTPDVTCVAENWFVSNDNVLSFFPSFATHLSWCYNPSRSLDFRSFR